MSAHVVRADRVDQCDVWVEATGHASLYQRDVYISSGQSLIDAATALRQMLSVASNPQFGARLKAMIAEAGFKNARQFALKGLEWPVENGPQRLNNYLKGRVPDIEIASLMASKLNVSVMDLYGLDDVPSQADDAMIDILRHLLSLEGIPAEKADTIANASVAAQRLLQALPEDDPLETRTKYAARAVWHQRQH